MKRIEDEYKNNKKQLLSYIQKNVSKKNDAEDLLHDVFLSAILNFNTLESINNVSSWLFTVAKNKIIDAFRKKKNISEADYAKEVNLEELIEDSNISIEDEYTKGWVLEQVELAIDQLPDNQKEVFILHEIKGYSYKKINEMTGVSVNTLLSRKRYAVQFLKKELDDIYYDLYEE